jgi:hypothetical protein
MAGPAVTVAAMILERDVTALVGGRSPRPKLSGRLLADVRPHVGRDAAETNRESSQRPFETVTPLAARLHLVPVTTWAVGQEGSLVKEIAAFGRLPHLCRPRSGVTRIDPTVPRSCSSARSRPPFRLIRG